MAECLGTPLVTEDEEQIGLVQVESSVDSAQVGSTAFDERPLTRDFLDSFLPTTAVSLSDDSIADSEIGNHFSSLMAA
jgi:hypothetical protein